MLQYGPGKRVTALEACTHPFFDELRNQDTRLPNGEALPPLFNFTAVELSSQPDLAEKLIPEWSRSEGLWPPPKLDPLVARRLIGAAKDGPRKSRSGSDVADSSASSGSSATSSASTSADAASMVGSGSIVGVPKKSDGPTDDG